MMMKRHFNHEKQKIMILEMYAQKLQGLKRQYKLYDDFLFHPDTKLDFDSRIKLVREMARILYIIKKIEALNNDRSRITISDITVRKKKKPIVDTLKNG